MEKRQSERVQFFQFAREDEVIPVWVFQRSNSDAVLGLLLDVGANGLQILTDKSGPMHGHSYQLIVHADGRQSTKLIYIAVQRLWSQAKSALYIRHGFEFVHTDDLPAALSLLLAAHTAGQKLLRCELVPT